MGLQGDLLLDCDSTARAGLARVFIAKACTVSSMTADTATHAFTAITMASSTDVFYEYEAEVETKELNGEGALSETGGTPSFTNTFQMKIIGLNKTNLKRVQDAINSRKLTLVIESANKANGGSGTYNQAFVVGWDNILKRDSAGKPNANYTIQPKFDGENSLTFIVTAKHAELVREFVGTIPTNRYGTLSLGS